MDTPIRDDIASNFWSSEILSGRIQQWDNFAKTKMRRWRLLIRMTHGLKRLLDIIGSICALVISSPILLITSLAIKLDDGGPTQV